MNREFCFTLPDETYIRFQSYKTMDEFRQELTRLCPAKIDLGAIYNIRPKDKSMVRPAAFIPVSKELVFDIDMTDYDEIRTCCSGGDVCTKCWEFMAVAMKIIDGALKGTLKKLHAFAVATKTCFVDKRLRQVSLRRLWIQALAVGILWTSWYPLLDW